MRQIIIKSNRAKNHKREKKSFSMEEKREEVRREKVKLTFFTYGLRRE